MTRERIARARELAFDAEAAAVMVASSEKSKISLLSAMAMRELLDLTLDRSVGTEGCLATCLAGLISASRGPNGEVSSHDIKVLEWTLTRDIEGINAANLPKIDSFADAVSLWPYGKPRQWPSETLGFAAEVAIRAQGPIFSILRRLFG